VPENVAEVCAAATTQAAPNRNASVVKRVLDASGRRSIFGFNMAVTLL
jgi:hypothetical protein